MTYDPMDGKTTVFTFESLADTEEPRVYDADEPTRELPLVAGRFAGREWAVEDLQREIAEKKQQTVRRNSFRRRAAVMAAAGAAAVVMLTGSLTVQAKLTAMNDEAAALTAEIAVLRREQDTLRVRYARSEALSAVEDYAVETLGMQQPRGDQLRYLEDETPDKATVLNIRRGRGWNHFWNGLVDRLGESFR